VEIVTSINSHNVKRNLAHRIAIPVAAMDNNNKMILFQFETAKESLGRRLIKEVVIIKIKIKGVSTKTSSTIITAIKIPIAIMEQMEWEEEVNYGRKIIFSNSLMIMVVATTIIIIIILMEKRNYQIIIVTLLEEGVVRLNKTKKTLRNFHQINR
jgi:hypothetical protein